MLQVRVPRRELLVHPDHPNILISIPKGGHTVLALGDKPITEVFFNYYPPITYNVALDYYKKLIGFSSSSHYIKTNDSSSYEYITVYIPDRMLDQTIKSYSENVQKCLDDLKLGNKNFIILFNTSINRIPIQGKSSENYILIDVFNKRCLNSVNGKETNILMENVNSYIENDTTFDYTSENIALENINIQRNHPFTKLTYPKTKVRSRITFSKIENLIIEFTAVYCSFFSLTSTLNNLSNFNKIFNTIEGLQTKSFSTLDQNNKANNIYNRIMTLFKNNLTNIENNLDSIGLLDAKRVNRHNFNDARFINHEDLKTNLVLDLEKYEFDNVIINKELPLFENVLLSLPKLDIKFKTESEFYRKILTIMLYSMYLNDVHIDPKNLINLSVCNYTVNAYNNMNFKGGTVCIDMPSKTILKLYKNLNKKNLNDNPYDAAFTCANINKPVGHSNAEIDNILNSLASVKP